MKMYMCTAPAGESNHPVYTIMSEKGILAETFSAWNMRVRSIPGRLEALLADKPDDMHQTTYLESRCVEDWVHCNWATEVNYVTLAGIVWPDPI